MRHLLDIVEIKGLCRLAGIDQIDAGPKGAVIGFRNKTFANPEGLIAFIREQESGVSSSPTTGSSTMPTGKRRRNAY